MTSGFILYDKGQQIYHDKSALSPMQNKDAIDIYLTEQDRSDLSGFMDMIQEALEKEPELKRKYQNPASLYLSLMNKYGRFWLNSNELRYRDSQAQDHSVKQLSIGRQDIIRCNGQVIPTIAVIQLKRLLASKPEWESLIKNIDQHRSHLDCYAEELRLIQ